MSVSRPNVSFVMVIAAFLRDFDRNTSRKRQITLIGQERLAGLSDGNQRRRTGRAYTKRRTLQPQLVSHARRQIVFFIAEHDQLIPNQLNQVRSAGESILIIGVVGCSREYANRTIQMPGRVACLFQRSPAGFEKYPLLRIHHLSFFWMHPEKLGIKTIRVFEQPARRHIASPPPEFGNIESRLHQFSIAEE